jgi:hypothetical protein
MPPYFGAWEAGGAVVVGGLVVGWDVVVGGAEVFAGVVVVADGPHELRRNMPTRNTEHIAYNRFFLKYCSLLKYSTQSGNRLHMVILLGEKHVQREYRGAQ